MKKGKVNFIIKNVFILLTLSVVVLISWFKLKKCFNILFYWNCLIILMYWSLNIQM